MANNNTATCFDNIAYHTHGVEKVLCVVFLVAAAENGHKLIGKVDFFKFREKVIPVALWLAVIPSWNAKKKEIVLGDIFFARFGNVLHVNKVFTELFLNHLSNSFCIARVTTEEKSNSGHNLVPTLTTKLKS